MDEATGQVGRGPLADVRVIELCNLAAGPWASMFLADMGADVVKVESPNGDVSRGTGGVHVDGESALFFACNRQKRSIRLDLKQTSGVEVFHRLVAGADVVIQNLRAGAVKRLGVDYDSVRHINPRIIYASISAFGSTGPYSSRPGNDPIAQALGGLMSVTGLPEEPALAGAPIPDFVTAALTAFGIMVALHERARSGVGQHIEATLLSATLSMMAHEFQEYFVTGQDAPRSGSRHPLLAPHQCFETSEGTCVYVAVEHEEHWRGLCHAVNRWDLHDDQRFRVNHSRAKYRDELVGILGDIFRSDTAGTWTARLAAHDVPCAPLNTIGQVLSDAQVAHNNAFTKFDHPRLGEIKTNGFPLKFSSIPFRIEREPPRLGAHTDAILRELCISDEEILELKRSQVC